MAYSRQGRGVAALGCLGLFCLPFLCAGLWTGGSAVMAFARWVETGSWGEAPATILETRLVSGTGRSSNASRAEARYEYVHEGRIYAGKRVALYKGSDSFGSFQYRAYTELEGHRLSGEPFVCLVNPHEPSEAVLLRDPRWDLLRFQAVFSLLFTGVGATLLTAGIVANRRQTRREALLQRHPDEPWRWREDWAKGHASSTNRLEALRALGLALFCTLLSLPILFVMPREVFLGNLPALLALAFPAVAIYFSVLAGRAVLRWRRYGESILELETVPAATGGALAGAIRSSGQVEGRDGFEITLRCLQKSGHGGNRQPKVLSDTVLRVPATAVRQLSGRTLIPINLPIAESAPGTSSKNEAGAVAWEVKVNAETPRGAYGATFEVPIFDIPRIADPTEFPETYLRLGPGSREVVKTARRRDRGPGPQPFQSPDDSG